MDFEDFNVPKQWILTKVEGRNVAVVKLKTDNARAMLDA
jgi:hypothetical protein